jgi:hypothetical protein
MGLLDVLNGMQNGPRGQRDPNANPSGGSGGMSSITMAILGLLAYKAVKVSPALNPLPLRHRLRQILAYRRGARLSTSMLPKAAVD